MKNRKKSSSKALRLVFFTSFALLSACSGADNSSGVTSSGTEGSSDTGGSSGDDIKENDASITRTPAVTGIYSEDYYIPGPNDRNWCEGMVSGNGENGVITSGAPYCDTLIFQNMSFVMPSAELQTIPSSVPDELEKTRDAILKKDSSWNLNGRKRNYHYNFHPGHELKLTLDEYAIDDYSRWTNFTTAEVGVTYSNRYGKWERKTFTSREDNVTITSIGQSTSGNKIDMTISIDNLSELRGFGGTSQNGGYEKEMKYKKVVDDDVSYIAEVAHYPVTTNSAAAGYSEAGFAGVTQIVTVGGTKKKVSLKGAKEKQNIGEEANPGIQIQGASAVYLITKSDRTFEMGDIDGFAKKVSYPLVDKLFSETNAVAQKYSNSGDFNYEEALEAHTKLHKAEFDKVAIDLNAPESDRNLSTEALIKKQQKSSDLLDAFVERAYYAGRYAQICSSGYSAPRLGGMWTGEWNPPWGSEYTMDANVNLQVSAMNTGNLSYSPLGYINFILRQVGDWLTNAQTVYGMHDAIQAPHFTDGDNALMIQSDGSYPFQYWNSGASWMLLPIYEYWQCYGNQTIPLTSSLDLFKIKQVLGTKDGGLTDSEVQALIDRGYLDLEKDILLPLLTKQSNFWEQLCTPEYYVDSEGYPHYEAGKTALNNGEKYLIIPSYSPENKPTGSYNKPMTMNSTMDIAAARNGLEMTIAMESIVNGTEENSQIAKWQNLINLLPDFQFDGEKGSAETSTGGAGALKEWSINGYYGENNTHRHLSHLYVAWPLFDTQDDPDLYTSAKQALFNRRRLNTGDATTGHGWIHQTLIAARLNESSIVYENMKRLMSSQIYFTSMMTDHNTNRGSNAYCTDTAIGMLGVINESLISSDTGKITVLPSFINAWKKGSISGIRARTQAEINGLGWDMEKGVVTVEITSDIDQTITLSSGVNYNSVDVKECEFTQNSKGVALKLEAGRKASVTFRA